MKLCLLLLSVLFSGVFSASAFAQSAQPCAPLVCGTYTGPTGSVDENNKLTPDGTSTETVVLADLGANKVSLKVTENPAAMTWDLVMNFQPDGQFTVTRAKDGSLYGSGVCALGVCSYSLVPFDQGKGDGIISSSGTIRYSGGKLKRYQFFTSPNGTYAQLGDLSLVP